MAWLRVRDKAVLALTLLLIALALRLPFGWLLLTLFPSACILPSANYAASIVQELVLYGVPAGLLLRWVRPERHRTLSGRRRVLNVTLCVLGGAVIQYVLQFVTWLWTSLLSSVQPELTVSTIMMPRNLFESLLAFCALALVPAVAEETLFRGAVYPCLRKDFSEKSTFWITVFAFTLMHGSLVGLPAHFFVGWITTLLMMRTESLTCAMSFHLAYNGAALLLAYLPKWTQWDKLPPDAAVTVGGVLMLTAVVAVMMVQRKLGEQNKKPPAMLHARLLAAALLCGLTAQYLPDICKLFGW